MPRNAQRIQLTQRTASPHNNTLARQHHRAPVTVDLDVGRTLLRRQSGTNQLTAVNRVIKVARPLHTVPLTSRYQQCQVIDLGLERVKASLDRNREKKPTLLAAT